MKPYAQVLKQFEDYYAPSLSEGRGPSKSALKRLYNAVRDALPSLHIHVVARVRGPIIDKHVRGQLGRVKFEYKHQRDGDPNVENVANCIVSAFANSHGLHEDDFVGGAIVTEVAPLLEKALLDVKNHDKAAARAEENKKLQQEGQRRQAMETLARTMESWQYTEEEVVQAWRTAQIKAVMES